VSQNDHHGLNRVETLSKFFADFRTVWNGTATSESLSRFFVTFARLKLTESHESTPPSPENIDPPRFLTFLEKFVIAHLG
jgi:hypothetical protein